MITERMQELAGIESPKNSLDEFILALSLSESQVLNENQSLDEGVKDILNKLGLTIHKTRGIIDYIAAFTKGVGRIIAAAIKGDRQKVKQIASQLKKEDVVDFLLKLDMATLHLVTGPIHFIDAVTGWDLWANVKHVASKANSIYDEIKKAIEAVKKKIVSYIERPKREQMLKPILDLEAALAT